MRWLFVPALLACFSPAAAETGTILDPGATGAELRYRFESVEQDDEPWHARAGTLRLRLRAATVDYRGLSALVELDHVGVIGAGRYDDTRNHRSDYPVVADPGGTDLNQAYLQYSGPGSTTLRLGRQRISHHDERFVGSVGWRQNEQTFDALRINSQALASVDLSYAFVDRVMRVFGPQEGTPTARFGGASHLFHARLTSLPAAEMTLYAYRLDFDNAPQLSSDTLGLRYDARHRLGDRLEAGWSVAYARQTASGGRIAALDADHRLIEARLSAPKLGFTAGLEILSGARGTFAAAANPAFQTPLATLHKWQGWADKFATTPSAGIEDFYFGIQATFDGWSAQAMWHDFAAQATSVHYGRELDLALSRRFAGRYQILTKYAGYSADGLFADTHKFWVQVDASF